MKNVDKNKLENSKIVQILQSLSLAEQKQLKQYLGSKWAVSNKKLLPLYQAIIKYQPDFDSPKLTKIRLYRSLYPNKKYNDKVQRNLLSELVQTIQDFLVHQRLRKDKNLQQKLLVQEWLERHQIVFFEQTIDKAIAQLEAIELKDATIHRDLYDYYMLWYHHPNLQYRLKMGGDLLHKAAENLMYNFSMNFAPIVNERKERQTILKTENYDLQKDIEMLKWLSQKYPSKNLQLYLERIDTKEQNPKARFYYLIQVFEKIEQELSNKDRKIHFMSLLNDGVKLYLSKQISIDSILELYKKGLTKKYLLHYNRLSGRSFTNIVTLADIAQDFDLTKEMISTYSAYLASNIQAEALAWARGHLAYYQNKFEETVDILNSQDFQDMTFNIQSRILLLQSNFERFWQNEDNFLYFQNYTYAFEKYISRNASLTESRKKSYTLLIQFLRQWATAVFEKNKGKQKKLKEELEKIEQIQARAWLKRIVNR